MLDHRLSVREKHLKGVNKLTESGILSACERAGATWRVAMRSLLITNSSFLNCAEFGGAILAPEFTDEKGRNKMMGSVIFYEAESIEEVRNLVEVDPYLTDGVVRAYDSSDSSPTTDSDLFDIVGQREARNSPLCASDALAIYVDGERTATITGFARVAIPS